MSYLPLGARRLPQPSTAMRAVSRTSQFHFNGQTVIGDGPGRLVLTDSRLEMNWLKVLLARSDTADLHEQVMFEWHDFDGICHNHFFDFVVSHTDGNTIAYTVRPEARTGGSFAETMPQIAKQARTSHLYHDVRLLTDKMLDPIELTNAWLMHGMRTPEPVADDAAATVLAGMNGIATLSALAKATGLSGQGYRALVRLISSQHLLTVRHERIDLKTEVYKRKNIQ